jgi:hypothetical protein
VPLDTLLGVVLNEGTCRELTAMVRSESAKFSLGFRLRPCLECHECRHGLILRLHQCQPHIAAEVVDEEEEELIAA